MIRRESRRHVRERRTDRRCWRNEGKKQTCKSKYKFCIAGRAKSRRLSACEINGKFSECDFYIIKINLHNAHIFHVNVFLDPKVIKSNVENNAKKRKKLIVRFFLCSSLFAIAFLNY